MVADRPTPSVHLKTFIKMYEKKENANLLLQFLIHL
jgi:hypothetical protein